MDTFSKVLEVNGHRLIIAHSNFEPDGTHAVEFRRSIAHGENERRGLRWTKQQFEQRCQKLQRLEAKLRKIVSEIEGEQFLPEALFKPPWPSPDYRPDQDLPGTARGVSQPCPARAVCPPRPPAAFSEEASSEQEVMPRGH